MPLRWRRLCLALILGLLWVAALAGCVHMQVPEQRSEIEGSIESSVGAAPRGGVEPSLQPDQARLQDPGPADRRARRANGWLAYIGGDGNVYVTTARQRLTIQITSDATAGPEESGLSYHRLAWSRDNQLAFAAVTRSGSQAHGKLYVAGPIDLPTTPGSAKPPTPRLVAENDEHFIIYSYWSPVRPAQDRARDRHTGCEPREACGRLAYLVEETDGVGLHLLDFDTGGVIDRLINVGRPYYFSWSRDGRYLLWHTGGATRHNPAAEIRLLDVADSAFGDCGATGPSRGCAPTTDWPFEPGLFHAPAWAPDGHGWLAVVGSGTLEKDTDRLLHYAVDVEASAGGLAGVQAQAAQGVVVARALDRRIAFAWSPDGGRVAYAMQEQRDDTFYGPVHVWDAVTGEVRSLTNPAFDIAGFFWSPDGQRLAYLSRLILPGDIWMQWRTYDVDRQVDRGFTAFHPSPLMEFMIHSFNQYAQSHSVWSPDGRYLVYADRDHRLMDRVWLVDTLAPAAEGGTDPILIDEGSFGIWSWGQVEE